LFINSHNIFHCSIFRTFYPEPAPQKTKSGSLRGGGVWGMNAGGILFYFSGADGKPRNRKIIIFLFLSL